MGTLMHPAAAEHPAGASTEQPPGRKVLLVWIDSREAILLRWADDAARIERLRSDVPAHHRATGNVRHSPVIRHGGGGAPQTAGEPRRLEHLQRFVETVMDRVAPDEDVLCLGPGTVHERLGREIRARDDRHHLERSVRCEPSPRQTHAQLTARLRRAIGEQPRRRTVGAYRWSERLPVERSGRSTALPNRVAAAHRPARGQIREEG